MSAAKSGVKNTKSERIPTILGSTIVENPSKGIFPSLHSSEGLALALKGNVQQRPTRGLSVFKQRMLEKEAVAAAANLNSLSPSTTSPTASNAASIIENDHEALLRSRPVLPTFIQPTSVHGQLKVTSLHQPDDDDDDDEEEED